MLTNEVVMLEVKGLFAGYGSGDIIKDISFNAPGGECLSVLGPNGCGKSTLLKSIARIINYRGLVLLDNSDIAAIPRKELAKKIALLGQASQVSFPYTVHETVSMGRYAHSRGFLKSLSAEDNKIIDDIINKLDIADMKERMIDELSGGQLQRVFLARTLVQNPDLILLDEPTSHLDLKYQIELLVFLKTWVKENKKILICVFHDINLARYFSDTAVLMNNGAVAFSGKIEETLNDNNLQEVYEIDISAFLTTKIFN